MTTIINDPPKKKKHTLSINITNTRYKVVKHVAKALHFKIAKQDKDDWDLCWIDTGMTPEKLTRMKPFQKINHFPGMAAVARKNYLGRNLHKMSKVMPKEYNFFPPTWMLPTDWNDLKAQFTNKKNKTYIVKPEASCQGQGIFLTRSMTAFRPGDHYVVQRYVHKPYLIDNLKFDLRVYALVLGCDPMRIYIYKEGLARFATEEYIGPNNGNLANLFMHLTNYAINKNSDNFIFNEDEDKTDVGHKRSLTSIWNTIDQSGGNSEEVISKIEDIIVKTMCAVQPSLAHVYRSCQVDEEPKCFEILGFDILLDHKLKPWLLEVNHSPSFSVDTPFDYKIKYALIHNTIKLLNISAKKKIKCKILGKSVASCKTATNKGTESSQKAILKDNDFEENEKECIGTYKLIYPSIDSEYDKYINTAKNIYEELTGNKRKSNRDKEDTPKPKSSSMMARKFVPHIRIVPKQKYPIFRVAEDDDMPHCESPEIEKLSEYNFQSSKTQASSNTISLQNRNIRLNSGDIDQTTAGTVLFKVPTLVASFLKQNTIPNQLASIGRDKRAER